MISSLSNSIHVVFYNKLYLCKEIAMIKCEYIFHEVCLGTKQKFDRVEKKIKKII